MRVSVASDHAGFPLKQQMLPVIRALGHEVIDVGTHGTDPVDYPDLAEADRGICAAERSMIEELVGDAVRLSECRLDGGSCCRFTVGAAVGSSGVSAAVELDADEPLQSRV